MLNKKILFVCMGNICRSPAAETIMNSLIKRNNLEGIITVDSAGTIDYHTGEEADPRMQERALLRGLKINHLARGFNARADFDKFDYIVTMDDKNYKDIYNLDDEHKYRRKLFKMISFCSKYNVNEVPDPYYKGTEGFDLVLDILEDACEGLLKKIVNDIKRSYKKVY